MSSPPVEICMPFQPLLLSMTESLGYAKPLYLYTEVSNNSVSVCIRTPTKPISLIYDGGEAATVEESCEKAAREAVLDLKMRTDMYILDLTSRELNDIDRSTALYNLKRVELERIEKGLARVELLENLDGQSRGFSKVLSVDYMSILEVVFKGCGILNDKLEVLEIGIGGFMAWCTLPSTGLGKPTRCIFGEYCYSRASARQNIAVKLLEYLKPLYNYQIVDVNYDPERIRRHLIECDTARDKYLASKQRILGVKEEPKPVAGPPDHTCITPKGDAYQIPQKEAPPRLIRKRGYTCFEGSSSNPPPLKRYVRRGSAIKRGSALAATDVRLPEVPPLFSPTTNIGFDKKPPT